MVTRLSGTETLSLSVDGDSEFVGRRGPWTFTRESLIAGPRADDFYALYNEAFGPLRARSAARQVLTPAEFYSQLDDPRVDKFVAWSDGGEAVGLTTLTHHLETVPWISPEYFAVRYPQAWAAQAVFYLGFTVARQAERRQGLLETIFETGIRRMAGRQVVVAYDICHYNDTVLRFQERLAALLTHYPDIEMTAIDTQTYYAVTFS